MTEKPDLETLLNVLIKVTEGFGDTELKKLAEDVKKNPMHNRLAQSSAQWVSAVLLFFPREWAEGKSWGRVSTYNISGGES